MSKDVSLDKLVMLTGDLPSMPFVAYKIMEIVADPNSTIKTLKEVIQNDQALAGRILKIANSALYARSRQITTLADAIVMLGFNSIRSLAVTSATRNLYLRNSKVLGLKDKLLWEHSVGAAVAGRLVARYSDPKLQEEAFLWGLLHDIGKLVILQRLPDEFDQIVQTVYNEGREFVDVEREILGFTHERVGSLLVRKWNLSERFENAVLYHNSFQGWERAPDLWIYYIDLANKVAKKLGFGFVRCEDLDVTKDPSAKQLKIDPTKMEAVVTMAQQMIAEAVEIFK